MTDRPTFEQDAARETINQLTRIADALEQLAAALPIAVAARPTRK